MSTDTSMVKAAKEQATVGARVRQAMRARGLGYNEVDRALGKR